MKNRKWFLAFAVIATSGCSPTPETLSDERVVAHFRACEQDLSELISMLDEDGLNSMDRRILEKGLVSGERENRYGELLNSVGVRVYVHSGSGRTRFVPFAEDGLAVGGQEKGVAHCPTPPPAEMIVETLDQLPAGNIQHLYFRKVEGSWYVYRRIYH